MFLGLIFIVISLFCFDLAGFVTTKGWVGFQGLLTFVLVLLVSFYFRKSDAFYFDLNEKNRCKFRLLMTKQVIFFLITLFFVSYWLCSF